MHLLVENDEFFLIFLGVIHRNVGIAQNVFGFLVIRIAECDADADAGKNLSAVDGERLGIRLATRCGKAVASSQTVNIVKIMANSSPLKRPTNRLRASYSKTLGDMLNQFVAHRMSETVVDRLETVEV